MTDLEPRRLTTAELDALLEGTNDSLDALESVLNASVATGLLSSTTKGVDLAALLAENQHEIELAEEAFIEAHCGQLDNLCRLYREVTQCEMRLQEFERDISQFQGTLTVTAEDIVSMQSRTVELVHRIDNRKDVSQRLQRVYEALNESDDFCEKISNAATVDAKFLQWIRELEGHIAFLADNPELEDSNINKTFTPKLEAAALRAGDKLHKYLLKKLSLLTEENSNVALIQQAIERQGQYAFAFLLRYNAPIANDILNQYIKMMSDVYLKQTQLIGKVVFEIVQSKNKRVTSDLELFVPGDVLMQLGGVRQQHASVEASVAPYRGVTPAPSMQRPHSRSISLTLGLAFDRIRGKVPERRDATFADNALALRSIDTSYRLVTMDPAITIKLDSTTCWVHRFSEMYCKVVNNVINEGRFIDHFFFSAGTTEQEETLLHLILDRSLDSVAQIVAAEIPAITDLIGVLCAKRALELFKNFVTQSADPLPIMIMAGLFEHIGGALGGRLDTLMAICLASLQDVDNISAFKPYPPQGEKARDIPFVDVMTHDALLSGRLAPHDVVIRYAESSCRIHLINTLLLEGSRVAGGGTDRIFFDDSLHQYLTQSVTIILGIIKKLAARHDFSIASAVFEVNNIGHIVMSMAWAEETYLSCLLEDEQPQDTRPTKSSNTVAEASDEHRVSSPVTQSRPRSPEAAAWSAQHHQQNAGGFGKPLRCTNITATTQYSTLLENLRAAVATFIDLDMRTIPATSGVLRIVNFALDHFGPDFFREASAGTPIAPPNDLTKADVLESVSTFHRDWQASMGKIADSMKMMFPERGGELAAFVLREYFAALVTMNSRLKVVVDRCFGGVQELKAKLVGNLAFTHEVARYIHGKSS